MVTLYWQLLVDRKPNAEKINTSTQAQKHILAMAMQQ
jgi:hypothetical protein